MTVRKELMKQINLTITVNQKNPTPMVKNILKDMKRQKNLSNIQRNNSKKTSLKLEIN